MIRNAPEATTEFFQNMLGLNRPWYVDHISFDAAKGRLALYLDFERGGSFTCGACGTAGCKAYDTHLRNWRHLDFWGIETRLVAPAPRVRCPRCGIRQARVSWARTRRRLTEPFEDFLVVLSREMPVRAVARIVGERDTRIGRVVSQRAAAPRPDGKRSNRQ